MLGFLISIIFFWLFFKTIGLTLRITWGMAKIVAGILMVIALPVLILGILFTGGILLFLPLILIAIAAWIAKTYVEV